MNRKLGTDWQKANQVSFRLNWLRSLGMIEKNEAGGFCRSARIRIKPWASQGTLKGGDVPTAAASVPYPTTLDALIASLESNSIKGGSGAAFEKAVANALSFLGFETSEIGGSSDTDL